MSARSGSTSSVSFRFLAVALAEEALALAFVLGFAEALPFALGVGALGTSSVSDPESSVIGGKIAIVMAANS